VFECSVAQRFFWAASRSTTRTKDLTYSLMGVFNVNMPLLYGEGPKAFIRLQEEILKDSTDQSIFVWHHDHPIFDKNLKEVRQLAISGVLATHPSQFRGFHHSFCFIATPGRYVSLEDQFYKRWLENEVAPS
jgi:hypothetical protein